MELAKAFCIPEVASMVAEFLTLDDLDSCVLVCKDWHIAFSYFAGRRMRAPVDSCGFPALGRTQLEIEEVLGSYLAKHVDLADYGHVQPFIRSFDFAGGSSFPRNLLYEGYSSSSNNKNNASHQPLTEQTQQRLLLLSRHVTRLYIRPYFGINWGLVLQMLQSAHRLKELVWNEFALENDQDFIVSALQGPCGAHLLRLEFESIPTINWGTIRKIGQLCPRLRDLILHQKVKIDPARDIEVSTEQTIENTDVDQSQLGQLLGTLGVYDVAVGLVRRVQTRTSHSDQSVGFSYNERAVFPSLEHIQLYHSQPREIAALLSHTPLLTSAVVSSQVFETGAPVMEEALVHDGCGRFIRSLTLVGPSNVSAGYSDEAVTLEVIRITASLQLEHLELRYVRAGSRTLLKITEHHAKHLKVLKLSDVYSLSNRVVQGLLSQCPMLEHLEIRPQSAGPGGCLLDASQLLTKSFKPWVCQQLRVLYVPFRIPTVSEVQELQVQRELEHLDACSKPGGQAVKRAAAVNKDLDQARPVKKQRVHADHTSEGTCRDGDENSSSNIEAVATVQANDNIDSGISSKEKQSNRRRNHLNLFFDCLHTLQSLERLSVYYDRRQLDRSHVYYPIEVPQDDPRIQHVKQKLPLTCKLELLPWTKRYKTHCRPWPRPSPICPRCGSSQHCNH